MNLDKKTATQLLHESLFEFINENFYKQSKTYSEVISLFLKGKSTDSAIINSKTGIYNAAKLGYIKKMGVGTFYFPHIPSKECAREIRREIGISSLKRNRERKQIEKQSIIKIDVDVFSKITDEQLFEELKKRGYKGELNYTKTLKF